MIGYKDNPSGRLDWDLDAKREAAFSHDVRMQCDILLTDQVIVLLERLRDDEQTDLAERIEDWINAEAERRVRLGEN